MRPFLYLIIAVLLSTNALADEPAGHAGLHPDRLSVMDFGARADGKTDDTPAIQTLKSAGSRRAVAAAKST